MTIETLTQYLIDNQEAVVIFTFAFFATVFVFYKIFFTNPFMTVVSSIVGTLLVFINIGLFSEVDDFAYVQTSELKCVSKHHSTPQRIKKFFNSEDQILTPMEIINIRGEETACLNEITKSPKAPSSEVNMTAEAAKAKAKLLSL